MAEQTRIVLIDDHPVFRVGLRELLQSEPTFACVGEASTAADGIALIEKTQPHIAIVDLSLREGSGLEMVKQLHVSEPNVRCLVCSVHDEDLYAERVLRAGARGYLNKQEAASKVVAAVLAIAKGEVYVGEEISQRLVRQLAEGKAADESPIKSLTDRELEIFELIGSGKSAKQIASNLSLSVKTVDTHRQNIRSKLGLSNSHELTREAIVWVSNRS